MYKIIFVTVILLSLFGCSNLSIDCQRIAPKGNWKVIKDPTLEVADKFSKKEDDRYQWFRSGKAIYGLCVSCGDIAPSKAYTFQSVNLEKESLTNGDAEELIITTCGPY